MAIHLWTHCRRKPLQWLTLTNVQPANAGNYSVLITNIAGSIISSNAALTVNVPPGISTSH